MNRFVINQGVDADWVATLTADGRTPATGFTSADVPAVEVWPGGSRAPLSPCPLVVSWVSAPEAQVKVTVIASRTASLAAGTYAGRLTVSSGGRTLPGGVFQFVVSQSSGSATADPVYGPDDDSDLVRYCSNIRRLIRDEDQTGYRAKRALARQELDALILQRYRPLANGLDYFGAGFGDGIGLPGYGFGWEWTRETPPNAVMKTALDNNGLVVTPTTRKIVASYALWAILSDQIESAPNPAFERMAARYLAQYDYTVRTYRPEIDINGDGIADVFIDFSTFTMHTR